jgi:hypothetical protein
MLPDRGGPTWDPMLSSASKPANNSGRPATARSQRDAAPARIGGIEFQLRRLADSSEPAVVFSSLVRLCVPAFCDVCSIDIVEGGRVRYRISYPQLSGGPSAPAPDGQSSVITTFESGLPGWASYSGVMTSGWHDRRANAEDDARAAAIVDHAIQMVRRERLADQTRPGLVPDALKNELRSQLRCR